MCYDEDLCTTVRILRVVCGVGSILSLISFVVLTRRNVRSSSNSYLAAMAICDILFLLSMIYLGFFPGMPLAPLFNTYRIIWPLMLLVNNISLSCSTWIVCCFMADRYIAIYHKVQATAICTISCSLRVTGVVVSVCVLWFMPTAFKYHFEIMSDDNETVKLSLSSVHNDKLYRVITFFLTPTLMVALPLSLLVYFIVSLLAAAVCAVRHTRRRNMVSNKAEDRDIELNEFANDDVRTTGNDTREQGTSPATMGVAVGSWFLMCAAAPAAIYLYNTLGRAIYGIEEVNYNVTVLTCVIPIGNFILYCLFAPEFHKTLTSFLASACSVVKEIFKEPLYAEMPIVL